VRARWIQPDKRTLLLGLVVAAVGPLVLTPALVALGTRYPTMYYLILIALAAALGRLAVGILAAIVSVGAFDYGFLFPTDRLTMNADTVVPVVSFLAVGILIAELVSSRDTANQRAAALASRLRILDEASRVFGASLEYDETLRALGRVFVPTFADWYSVHLLGTNGVIETVRIEHPDPDRIALAQELQRTIPERDIEGDDAIATVLRTAEPQLVPEVTEQMITDALKDRHPELIPVVLKLGLTSVMTVPLVIEDRAIGAIQLMAAESHRRFSVEDLAIAKEIAQRAAVAVSNARRFTEHKEAAAHLQERLLPKRLAEIPGMTVAARYIPPPGSTTVGGDFYDVFEIGEGVYKALVGDVRGKGTEAAALMGFVRHTVRAISKLDGSPATTLHELNHALLEEAADDPAMFWTACLVRIHPSEDGGARLTIGVGGHPLPYLIRADGDVSEVGRSGTLLGMFEDISVDEVTLDLHAGDSLVMLTDGALEATSDGWWEATGLEGVLSTSAGLRPETIIDRLDATIASLANRREDDTALVVLQVPQCDVAPDAISGGRPGVLLADEEMRYVDASSTILATLGYSKAELLRLSVADVVAADVPWTAQEYDRFLVEGTWQGDVELRTSNGSTLRANSLAHTLATSDGRLLHEAVITPVG
jgi:serine phosphatase RsbU (regulator of sigma subunit)